MTTIAYRRGLIASDSFVCSADLMVDQICKLHPLPDGSIVGFAGDVAESFVTLHDLRTYSGAWEDLELVEGRENHTALIVTPKRKVFIYHYKTTRLIPHSMPYAAIGSGRDVALGALSHGASAIEAVRAAIKHDTNSGGRIHSRKVF